MVDGARLESVYRGDSIVGSNPTVSATKKCSHFGGFFCGGKREGSNSPGSESEQSEDEAEGFNPNVFTPKRPPRCGRVTVTSG